MRISDVICPPSEKFPAFIPCWSNITIVDIFTHGHTITTQRVDGSFISYQEHTNGIELKYSDNGNNFYYYIPYSKSLRFKQSYNKITEFFDFAHDNQTLYYVPKTISVMFNYTNLRPSLQNYTILFYTIDVYDIRNIVFYIWSHILLADKNRYEMIDASDIPNQLWTLVGLL